MCGVISWVVGKGCLLWPVFCSWQNSVSLFCFILQSLLKIQMWISHGFTWKRKKKYKKIQTHIIIFLEFFEKYQCWVLLFSRSPDMFLMSIHFWKQLGHMRIFYFYLVCFIYSISHSVIPFHLGLCFPVSPSLLFVVAVVLSQAFIKHGRKVFVYIYI